MTRSRSRRGPPAGRRLASLAAAALLAQAGATACGGGGPRPNRSAEPLVFAATSTADALEQGSAAFQSDTGILARASYGPTSMLAQQIVDGAPADLFLAASVAWADFVADRVPVVERRPLVGNALVVIRPTGGKGSPAPDEQPEAPIAADAPEGARTLETPSSLERALGTGRIAVADPDAVPAGIYARQALTAAGLWERLRSRLVPTLDVRAALTLVERGEAEAGIVYRSDAALTGAVEVAGVVDPRLHEPIVYPLLLLRESEAARRLYEFLATPAGLAPFSRRSFVAVGPRVR